MGNEDSLKPKSRVSSEILAVQSILLYHNIILYDTFQFILRRLLRLSNVFFEVSGQNYMQFLHPVHPFIFTWSS
jgi:hypothetical protein